MLAIMINSLIAPRYPRGYIGRHRCGPGRFTHRIVTRRRAR